MKIPKIPTQVRFPFGFVVPVKWRDRIPGADGQYDPNHAHIELSSSTAPTWEQIEAFAHEVVHAAIDFNRWVLQEIVAPLKAEAEETKRALDLERD